MHFLLVEKMLDFFFTLLEMKWYQDETRSEMKIEGSLSSKLLLNIPFNIFLLEGPFA